MIYVCGYIKNENQILGTMQMGRIIYFLPKYGLYI